jgi:hypothetical protein
MSTETRREYMKRWRHTPKQCACGQPGVKMAPGGMGWICQRCLAIDAASQASRLKFTNRKQAAGVVEEYRLCLPGSDGRASYARVGN